MKDGRVPHPVTTRPSWGPDAVTATAVAVAVMAVWVVAKLVAVWAWVAAPREYGDTYYYFMAAQQAAAGEGVAAVMREYPTPAGLLLMLPYELGATHHDSYRQAIIMMTSLADGAFALLLGRRLGPVPVLAWIAITSALGQLALLRFDMLPAAVAGAGVLLAMGGRGGTASALVGLGTGLKLWPLVLAPLTLRPGRLLRPVAALASVGAGLVALSVATGGLDRLVSPLGYQRDRGLQIEAVAATVPMLTWAEDESYRVWYSTFHAFEVVGPSVEYWLRIAEIASWAGIALCAVLLARWWWAGAPAAAIGWIAITFVGIFVVTSRALSPQYLLWIAAPAVVVLGYAWCAAGRPDAEPAPRLIPALATVVGVLALCALTTAIYPVYYSGVTARGDTTERTLLMLLCRNAGLLALVASSAVCAFLSARSPTKIRRRTGAM